MTIGDRIKKQRERLGISQTELANRIKSSKQTLYKYENNIITNIPSDKLEKISEVLCVSPAFLMGWEENLKKENADIIPDLMSNQQIVEAVRKLLLLNKEHQRTILDNITYWYEKEGH